MSLFRKRLGYEKATAALFGKPKAKKFNYSSEMNSIILEQALSDAAALSESTVSYVIEDLLIERFIPMDDHARHYVTKVLFGKTYGVLDGAEKKYGIREALCDIFADESAGTAWGSRHDNNRQLVEFACDLLKGNRVIIDRAANGKVAEYDGPTHRMLDSWDSVCGKLEDLSKQREEEGLSTYDCRKSVEYGRSIGESLEKENGYLLYQAVSFILENWEALGCSTHTYRFLSAAMEASRDWTDSPEERAAFTDVCQEVMSGWTAADNAREDAKEKARLGAVLTDYDMADGDVVSAPRGWLVANPEDALTSKHAGVIEVKNGERYDAPCILFFCDTPVGKDFTDEQRAKVLVAATSVWPRLSEVQADEVDLQYGPNGGIVNMKEFSAAPCIGMFRIYDRGKYPSGKPPYGACVTRAGKEGNN